MAEVLKDHDEPLNIPPVKSLPLPLCGRPAPVSPSHLTEQRWTQRCKTHVLPKPGCELASTRCVLLHQLESVYQLVHVALVGADIYKTRSYWRGV